MFLPISIQPLSRSFSFHDPPGCAILSTCSGKQCGAWQQFSIFMMKSPCECRQHRGKVRTAVFQIWRDCINVPCTHFPENSPFTTRPDVLYLVHTPESKCGAWQQFSIFMMKSPCESRQHRGKVQTADFQTWKNCLNVPCMHIFLIFDLWRRDVWC